MRLIDADTLKENFPLPYEAWEMKGQQTLWLAREIRETIDLMPTVDAVEVVRCKDCVHQEKFFHEDKRRKDGGYYIFGCEFAEGYSHVCLDDDYCSEGKRRTDE